MSIGGWAEGGVSQLGRSKQFDNLPWDGYRQQGGWLEQFADAFGLELDTIYNAFCSASARANQLDPTFTPTISPNKYQAMATAAPTEATIKHTMLDIMLTASGVPWPVNGLLTIVQRQALVFAAQASLKRKGNRIYLLNLGAPASDGVIAGWTAATYNASLILPDGAPSPGYGGWNTSTGGISRPWVLAEVRRIAGRIFPAWSEFGVGYSQFRADFSAAGEPVYPAGATLNHLANEHFQAWAASVPTSWTKLGTGTLTQVTSNTYLNYEFYDTSLNAPNVARFDLSAAVAGTFVGLRQSATVNDQVPHRVEVDYVYTNTQNVNVLAIKIADLSTGVWWDDANQRWTTVDTANYVVPSTTRRRAAFNINLNAMPQSSNVTGTYNLRIDVLATCDGTATTQTTYDLYRVAVYERFDLGVETEASGERLLWAPLIDSIYPATNARTGTITVVAPANAARSRTRRWTGSSPAPVAFEYHPALTSTGYRSSTAWTNIIYGSNDFITDWTAFNASVSAAGTSGPEYSSAGTVSDTAKLTGSGVNAQIFQSVDGGAHNPANNTYVAGVWAKKISGTSSVLSVQLSSGATIRGSQDYTLTSEWQWCAMSPTAFQGGDTLALAITMLLGSSDMVIGIYNAYCYNVTTKPDVLYPTVIQSAVGGTGAGTATALTAPVTDAYLKRQSCSAVRGSVSFTFVPTCGRNPGVTGNSQPNGVLFDIAEGAAQNRVVLRVASNVLELRRWDDLGTNHAATLTLAYTADVVTELKWRRDEAITIRCVWNDVSTQLSAGSANANFSIGGTWTPNDDSLTAVGIGNDFQGNNPIDGIYNNFSFVLLGAPTS